jgi:hypothetical protein
MARDSDIGDEQDGTIRDRPPDYRSPIDPAAPVSGHEPPPAEPVRPMAEEPEHDWTAAASRLMPLLRPMGTSGASLATIDREHLREEGLRSHAQPLIDQGPAGLAVAYAIREGGFDAIVNADHLLAWGIEPAQLRAVGTENLMAWSRGAPWTDETSGRRRLISSDTGDGSDAARILLPEVRTLLAGKLGAGARVLVGLPDRHLLVAGALWPDDAEFEALFRDFVGAHADDADEPIDRRVFEIVDGELVSFLL